MDDDRDVRDAVRAAGHGPTPATQDGLRASLLADLHGDTSMLREPHAQRRFRWWMAGAAAAAAAVAVAVIVVSDDDTAQVVAAGTLPEATVPAAPAPVTLEQLVGPRWIVVEQDGQPWPTAYVPYVEFGSSAPGGAIDPFFGGNDGCNWYGATGSVVDGRIEAAEVSSTAMDCGPGTGGVLPQNGDRPVLEDDGRSLTLLGPDGEARLRLARLDTLPPADTAVIGRWAVGAGAPGAFDLRADFTGAFGSCEWTWKIGAALVVSGWPADPYSCLGSGQDQTSSRLVEMLVGDGPVAARLGLTDTDLYLSDDQFVIRLTRVGDAPPAEASDPAAVDLVAGWPQPPQVAPDLALVPRLLPTIEIPGTTEVGRIEGADQPADLFDHSQFWVGGPTGHAALLVRTHVGQHPYQTPAGDALAVGTWDGAWLWEGPVSSLTLDDPSGMVTLSSAGLSRDELIVVARSLTRRSDGQSGWDVVLAPSFTALHEGWDLGAATRTLVWSGGPANAEMSVAWGATGFLDHMLSPVGSDDELSVTEVNGAPAVTYRFGPTSAVMWSPEPDVVVQLGLVGPPEDALAVARSVEPVDAATWEAASRPTTVGDGCNSLFC